MPAPQHAYLDLDDDGQPYSITYGKCFSHNIILLIEHAMRIAAESEDAPARCRKKGCRASGRCDLRMKLNGDGYCGAGITDSMIDKSVLMLHFLAYVGTRIEARAGSHAGANVGHTVRDGKGAGR